MKKVSVFAPATIGNVGPGFDCLGLCLDNLGDTVTFSESDEDSIEITGRDAETLPLSFEKNVVGIITNHVRAELSIKKQNVKISIQRSLPSSGGLGASAASSVAAAIACQRFFNVQGEDDELAQKLIEWSLVGEEAVAGRHLDNIAPCLFGGLTLSFFAQKSNTPVIRSYPVSKDFHISVVTPEVKVSTKKARDVLPKTVSQSVYCEGLANSSAVALALANGDADLLSYALSDPYAAPARASLIPHYKEAEEIALKKGALGFCMSGAGPTLFAICESQKLASEVSSDLAELYFKLGCSSHVCQVASQGAKVI